MLIYTTVASTTVVALKAVARSSAVLTVTIENINCQLISYLSSILITNIGIEV